MAKDDETRSSEDATDRFTFDLETHGSGGFARVIRGRDNVLDRDIAVKVLDPLATQFGEPERERFRREARILASLSHTNIPAIYDVHFSEDNFLIFFQFIEGTTLGKLIETEGACDFAEARAWFQQLASALEHAHSKEIIHRDIKPENIIITPDRSAAYLVDFGIALSAQEASRITESGYVIGTPGYMSPEQQAGEEIDWRTDMYSLAVTLYEALAGKSIPVGEYQGLSVGNEAIPPQIDSLVLDCIEPKDNRDVRPRTFAGRLLSTLTPARPLSEVLAHGRLHELAAAIEGLTAEDFMQLPVGQRALILAKVNSIVQSDDKQLETAVEQFLGLMLRRGILLDEAAYREIVEPATEWAFLRQFNGFSGRPSLQRAIEEAAHNSRGRAHEVLCEESLNLIGRVDLDAQAGWFLNAIGSVLQTLLSNQSCEKYANELAAAFRELNDKRRSRN